MSLFKKLGRMIGIGKDKKRFPSQKQAAQVEKTVFKPVFKPVNNVRNKNRQSHVSWAYFSLRLAKPYR